MENELNKILSLIERIDNVTTGRSRYYDNNAYDLDADDSNGSYETDYYDQQIGGKLKSNIVKIPKQGKKETSRKLRNNLNDIVSDKNETFFIDAIFKIGGYLYKKEEITQSMIENAFTQFIKNRKIFCPQLGSEELKNEIIGRNSERNAELSIEFNDDTAEQNIKNTQTPISLVNKYAPIYDNIRNNIDGRLGQFFELLFAKKPDNSKESDFGTGDGGVEVKTKHLDSSNGVIALTRRGIETLEQLKQGSRVCDNGKIRNKIVDALNERLYYLSKSKNLKFNEMFIIIRNPSADSNNVKGKRFVIQQSGNLYNETVGNTVKVIEKEHIANIYICSLKNKFDEDPYLASYKLFIEGSVTKGKYDNEQENIALVSEELNTTKKSDDKYNVRVTFILQDYNDSRFNKQIYFEFELSAIIKTIEEKAPILFVANGEEAEYKVEGWDCRSDVYVYTYADIFKFSGNKDDNDNTIDLIKRGLLKVDILVPTGKYKNVSSIGATCALSINYDKILENSGELFAGLFTYEKQI